MWSHVVKFIAPHCSNRNINLMHFRQAKESSISLRTPLMKKCVPTCKWGLMAHYLRWNKVGAFPSIYLHSNKIIQTQYKKKETGKRKTIKVVQRIKALLSPLSLILRWIQKCLSINQSPFYFQWIVSMKRGLHIQIMP